MEAVMKKPNYLERKRQAVLDMGYDFVRFKSRVRKSVVLIKKRLQNG